VRFASQGHSVALQVGPADDEGQEATHRWMVVGEINAAMKDGAGRSRQFLA
jgi:hypothetical protein